jgi:hypothetical protein
MDQKVTDLDEIDALADDDQHYVVDASDTAESPEGTGKRTPTSKFFTWIVSKIAALAGKTTPVDADFFLLIDSAASNAGKSLTWAGVKVALAAYFKGVPLQIVQTDYSAAANGTNVMPANDTIPQNTEGVEFMAITVTPKSATNYLEVEAFAMLCENSNVANMITGAIFRDDTVDALKATSMMADAGAYPEMLRVFCRVLAGSTTATTFKFRAGPDNSVQLNFNSAAGGARLFGGVAGSYIRVTEVSP